MPKSLSKLDSGAGDFFKANWGILLLAVLLVAALIAVTILALRMKKKNEEFKAAKAKEEHEKAVQAAFIANASHDLRTPLNGVTGYTALALKATTLQKKQEYLESITSCNALLTGLVIDILDLPRLDSGKMSLIPETMDPLKAYQDVIMMVAPLADQKNITLLSDESLCPHEAVVSDPRKFQRVILNLATNAIKFTPKGGHVNLQIEKMDPAIAGKNYRIIVKDDGIGMSPELQQNLFVPFHQDERPEAGTTGVGLGLSIVKGMLDLMGGSISVQSQVDKGSTITVNLPLKESQEPLKKRTALPRENALKGRSILVCEDDALNREIAKKILEAAGLQVDLAPDGGEGLRAISSSDPGHYVAILMDLRMPHVDGFGATKLIRSGFHPDAKAIPIIALTGEVYEAETKAAFEAGTNAVLAKPIDPQKLLSVLNEEVAKAANLH